MEEIFKLEDEEWVCPIVVLNHGSQLGEFINLMGDNLNERWKHYPLDRKTNKEILDRMGWQYFCFSGERKVKEGRIAVYLIQRSIRISLFLISILESESENSITTEEYNQIATSFYWEVLQPAATSLSLINYLTTKNNYSQIPLFIKEESNDSLVAMFTKPSGESKIIRVQE